jgi:methionyl-tRNA formyltransferase
MTDVIHLGSRPLSQRCFRILHNEEGINIKGVVTHPPDYEGWWDGSLYNIASNLGYNIINESDILDSEIDYIISTLYYNILDEQLLEHPKYGGINLHQAELPRYRGSHSFSHAILNAREDDYWKYGTTLHFMNEEVDKGPIVDRSFVEIKKSDTAKSLYEKVEEKSVDMFKKNLRFIKNKEINKMATPQSEYSGPVYYYTSEELKELKEIPVSWFGDNESEMRIRDRVRAVEFPPFEPAYVKMNGSKVYLTSQEYGGLI